MDRQIGRPNQVLRGQAEIKKAGESRLFYNFIPRFLRNAFQNNVFYALGICLHNFMHPKLEYFG